MSKLWVATAMIEPDKTEHLWKSWRAQSALGPMGWPAVVIVNGVEGGYAATASFQKLIGPGTWGAGQDPLGTVPAFAAAMTRIMEHAAADDVVALLHDDLEILEPGWDEKVLDFFDGHPGCVLAGFGGANGVGSAGMYECDGYPVGQSCRGPSPKEFVNGAPVRSGPKCARCGSGYVVFDPMTLARHDFMSNMRDAEAHGRRVVTARPVAVLDGFSLIGRAQFMRDCLMRLQELGVVHHAYDVFFGVEARRLKLQTWLLPYRCHHAGGMSAVGSAKYQEWAQANHGGDQQVWLKAHRAVWEAGRGVMPFDVREEASE